MEIRNDVKKDDRLRDGFLSLAKKEFGLDLRTWYENGFWQDDYIPYCLVTDGRVVSNVSLSVCNYRWRGKIHHLAQLGCVVTDDDNRGRGLSRAVMERVINDCSRSFEGIFLYAQEEMIPFYENFGFKRIYEWQCSKKVNITSKSSAEHIPMDSKDEWDRMVDIIQRRLHCGDMVMVNNPGLYMFYLTGGMSEYVWYIPSCEAYAVARRSGPDLTVYAVFSEDKAGLGDVIASFGDEIENVHLAFTPETSTGFEQCMTDDPENVLLVRGEFFSGIKNEHFMFPEISRT